MTKLLFKRLNQDSRGLGLIAMWFLRPHMQFIYTEADRARAALLLQSPLMAVNKTETLSLFMKKIVSAMIMY